ncbi:hypothetical protein BRC81_06480 [Halobacteriales archaeon QS_1_68_20]|nr:MAG: hypothetical protein BRC81_06480 [Halobacteriales archaeon QS_1_68_20]
MECPDCGAGTVAVRVPEDVRSYAPSEAVAVCTRCLRVHPLDDRPAETTDPGSVSDALPADADAAAALLLAGSLLESVAGNRQAIEALIEHAERAGADPVLAFERLAADPDLDPAVDLAARYRKFDQLRG